MNNKLVKYKYIVTQSTKLFYPYSTMPNTYEIAISMYIGIRQHVTTP